MAVSLGIGQLDVWQSPADKDVRTEAEDIDEDTEDREKCVRAEVNCV
jgi:hypothetical protein